MDQNNKQKPHINLAVFGHVDAGKSTTTGHLIFKCGNIDERTLKQAELEAEQNGRNSFKFAYLLSTMKAEKDRGITINISLKQFETEKFHYTVIDTPGHRDFIKNMITGTAQADIGLLVVSAAEGEFEAGISQNGQTKEHLLLAYTLGVKQLIVAVNKIDNNTVNYSEKRYNEIKQELAGYLVKIGYKPENVPFIPLSGWSGENLTEKSDNMPWYKGSTLIDVLNNVTAPKRPTDKPLRIPINDVYKIKGIGVVPSGRIETGILKAGANLVFAPYTGKAKNGIECQVKSIEMHKQQVKEGLPGDNVGFSVKGDETNEIKGGMVCGEQGPNAPREVSEFTAQVIVLNHNFIQNGYTPVVDCHTAHVACRFDSIMAKIDRKTGKVIEENPEFVKTGDCCLVKMIPCKPFTCETFQAYPQLGRFAVRDMKKTVAVGVIKETVKK